MDIERAFFFGDGGELFGVLHCAPEGPAGMPGWVICNAFGVERDHSHRLMVEWARELSRLGWPVLRFDYRGTGDSVGDFTRMTVGDHLEDILAAMREIERLTGRSAAGLLGLRLGASLAALAAVRAGGIGQLAFWEPVLDGAAYRDQLLRVALANEMVSTGLRHHSRLELRNELARGGAVFVDGFPLTGGMYDSLAEVEPGRIGRAPVRRALVVQIDASAGRPIRRGMRELSRAMSAAGEVCLETVVAPIAWHRSRQFRRRPPELFGRTAEWVARSESAPWRTSRPAGTGAPLRPAPAAGRVTRSTAFGRMLEEPVSFSSAGQQIQGILHSPGVAIPGRPGVVMLAAGETCRSAVFYTSLARILAASGWPTLRFDPRGLGDSHGEIDCSSVGEVFARIEGGLLVPDAAAAVEFLAVETGSAGCILTGLCGGAVTAVYAAAADARVTAIAPLELRMLCEGDGRPLRDQAGLGQLPWWERLSARRGGLVLLAARRGLHRLRSALRSLRRSLARLRPWDPERAFGREGWVADRLGGGANLPLIGAMKRVCRRGIPVLCLFADGEHRDLLESVLPGLLPDGQVAGERWTVRSIEGADHNFIMPGCRERLAEELLAWLSSPERPWMKPGPPDPGSA